MYKNVEVKKCKYYLIDTGECIIDPEYICPYKIKKISADQENAAFEHTECRNNCKYIDEVNFDYINDTYCVSKCPSTGPKYYKKNGPT